MFKVQFPSGGGVIMFKAGANLPELKDVLD